MSYKVRHLQSGRVVYYDHPVPLAFVVFAKDRPSGRPPQNRRWTVVAKIEARPYPNEHVRRNGSYVPLGRDMTAREKADQVAEWWQSIGNSDAAAVEVSASRRPRAIL